MSSNIDVLLKRNDYSSIYVTPNFNHFYLCSVFSVITYSVKEVCVSDIFRRSNSAIECKFLCHPTYFHRVNSLGVRSSENSRWIDLQCCPFKLLYVIASNAVSMKSLFAPEVCQRRGFSHFSKQMDV